MHVPAEEVLKLVQVPITAGARETISLARRGSQAAYTVAAYTLAAYTRRVHW